MNEQPWCPRDATDEIRKLARRRELSLAYKLHAKDRMLDRGIIVSDVLYVLKHGFVLKDSEPATRRGFFRYEIESRTPNSGSRDIRLIVIPQPQWLIKIVTVMWVDETAKKAGSLLSNE